MYSFTRVNPTCNHNRVSGADPGFFKRGGGSILGLQAKKGGSRRGSNFGPNVKKPTTWAKRGALDPLDPPPPDPPIGIFNVEKIVMLGEKLD